MSQNSNISYEHYKRILQATVRKSYAARFKKIRFWAVIFSFFGHIASIFLAYFFFIELMSAFNFPVNGKVITFSIVLLLTIFEALKRYTFDLLTLEYIKSGRDILRKNMISFIVATTAIVSCSFFFSLNGAKDLMDKEKTIVVKQEKDIKSSVDSISNYYFDIYIKPLKDENMIYIEQKNKLIDQQNSFVQKGWNIDKFVKQIDKIDFKIDKNKEFITAYEKQRDTKISILKSQVETKFNEQKKENKTNVIYFLILSFIIEIAIMIGVYYHRDYNERVRLEYEKEVMNTPGFRKWKKYNEVLELMYGSGMVKEDVIESVDAIHELSQINELDIEKRDIDEAFKVFRHLKIYTVVGGNRRVLKMDAEEAYMALRKHFKIK